MENKALKQRLESLAQEQLIKYCKFHTWKFFRVISASVAWNSNSVIKILHSSCASLSMYAVLAKLGYICVIISVCELECQQKIRGY